MNQLSAGQNGRAQLLVRELGGRGDFLSKCSGRWRRGILHLRGCIFREEIDGQKGLSSLYESELTFTFWGRKRKKISSKSFQSYSACDQGWMAETCYAGE